MTVSKISLQKAQWRGVATATVVAVGLYVGFRFLPTGTNLSHMDFRPDGNSVEMCDPSNPQFIPVVAVRSPVTLELTHAAAVTAAPVRIRASLHTASGRPIGPEDLLVVHTEKLHLLIVDPTLTDYQHVHPVPGAEAGVWEFSFTPRSAGLYRVFADFTPQATGRGLYGHADFQVEGKAAALAGTTELPLDWSLEPVAGAVRAGETASLIFTLRHSLGAPVPLAPVMGAYAHLVAFDHERQGYAHLHPLENDPAWRPDEKQPRLTFSITFPSPGDFVVWAQVKVGDQEVFHPFSLRVQ